MKNKPKYDPTHKVKNSTYSRFKSELFKIFLPLIINFKL
ncbi:hypothetical protein HME7025_02527 [Aquirufa nivalisilvae]|uniref:Uncharacterized protein n=1 Tax=Aquirufa nivalisilvae TaxID=2516557 RepID=A0A2S2E031_9BACT|nr:hypothetical protein HME7025_02527 [Aquirufa nivalisilvae]